MFAEEQGVPVEADRDGRDPEALHLVAVDNEDVVGTCRLVFRELLTQLTDPTFGSMPFLQLLDARFVASRSPWLTLVKEQPEVCRAVLRLHHVGMIGLPSGARMQEEHRSAPTADDWVLLVDDWLTGRLTKTGLAQDEQVVEAVRRALPSVGYQWTKRGIRRGRSPVDRVLARSASKSAAVVQICAWQFMHVFVGGMPAYAESSTLVWQ